MKVAVVAVVLLAMVAGVGYLIHRFGLEPSEPPLPTTMASTVPAVVASRPGRLTGGAAAQTAPVLSLARAKEQALERLAEKYPAYREQVAELARLKAKFEGMPQGTPQQTEARLQAQMEYNTLKIKLDARERDAIDQDPDVRASREAEERRVAGELEAAKRPIALPLSRGAIGTLPQFTVVRVIDATHMVGSVDGDEVLLDGPSTFGLKAGQPFRFDRPVLVRPSSATTGPQWVASPFTPK